MQYTIFVGFVPARDGTHGATVPGEAVGQAFQPDALPRQAGKPDLLPSDRHLTAIVTASMSQCPDLRKGRGMGWPCPLLSMVRQQSVYWPAGRPGSRAAQWALHRRMGQLPGLLEAWSNPNVFFGIASPASFPPHFAGGGRMRGVGPGGLGEVRVVGRPGLRGGMNPHLHLRQTGDANLGVASDRDRLLRRDRVRHEQRRRERLQGAVHVVVAVRVGVVGVSTGSSARRG